MMTAMASASSSSSKSRLNVNNTPPSPSPSAISSSTTGGDSSTSLASSTSASRLVRFSERCVLIPENCGRPSPPRIGTLEVNIPVGLPWRWPGGSPSPKQNKSSFVTSDSAAEKANVDRTEAALSTSPPKTTDVQRVVLKVPYPIFRRKSHSALQASVACPPSCLRHSAFQPSVIGSTFSRNRSPEAIRPKRRSNSLPLFPLDSNVETVPLRPCCEKCLAACEIHAHRVGRGRLPTLEESSREHTPSQSRLDLHESEEDWCAGLHFTKGAYKLWRSASADDAPRHSQEGSGLLDSLVRVDEVDRKRGSSPNPSVFALHKERDHVPRLNTRDLDRVKNTHLSPPSPDGNMNGSPTGSLRSQESEDDLFPLPSPKRSPLTSPSDSVTCLPAQVVGTAAGVPSSETRRLEQAIREKLARREKETQEASTRAKAMAAASTIASNPGPSSKPIPIPGSESRPGISHFHSNLSEIEWDPSGPDPDALPADSMIRLNSPPGSPDLKSSASPHSSVGGRIPHFSASVPSLHLHLPEVSRSHQPPLPPLARRSSSVLTPAPLPPPLTKIPSPPIPPVPPIPPLSAMSYMDERRTPNPRRPSISGLMRASVSALRGINFGGVTSAAGARPAPPTGPSASFGKGPGLVA